MHLLSTCVALCTCLPWVVVAYPSGAPSSVCGTMHPGHDVPAQTTPAPYTVRVSKVSYTPGGGILSVKIEGPAYKGFMLYAQRADWRETQEEPIGTFSVGSDAQKICGGLYGDAVTHTGASARSSAIFTWTPPADSQGQIEFRATIVQSKEVFWEDVFSDRVLDSTDPDPDNVIPPSTTPRSLQPEDALGDISSSGCGSEKGCMSVPKGCSGSGCDMMVTWTPSPATTGNSSSSSYVSIQLMGRTRGWVALGLSQDKTMGVDSVMECVVHDNWVAVGHSYNGILKGVTSPVSPYSIGISGANSSFVDGIIRCDFRRMLAPSHEEVFDLSNPYYLFLAVGQAARGVKFQHSVLPAVSTKQVVLASDTGVISGAGLSSGFIKAHAIVMLTAWCLLVGPAVVMARHYKDAWPGKKLCDKKLVWFSAHRIIQLSVMGVTILGFALIFVDVKGYSLGLSSVGQAHPVFGIIILVLVLINPLMGLLRPATNKRGRPAFNWAHRIVGFMAMILALINMFIGFMLRKSELITPVWLKYLLVLYVFFYIGVEVALKVHQTWLRRREYKRTTPTGHMPDTPNMYKKRGLRSKYIILGVYVGLSALVYFILMLVVAIG